MKKSFWLLLVPLLFLMARCTKETVPVLPPTSPNYEPYFECKVNGQLWKPDTNFFGIGIGNAPLDVRYSPYYGLSLSARNKAKHEYITIITNGYSLFDPLPTRSKYAIDTIGTYQLSRGAFTLFQGINDVDTSKQYYVKITKIDSVFSSGTRQPMFEGEFAFKTVGTTDTLTITEGKFGVIWRTY